MKALAIIMLLVVLGGGGTFLLRKPFLAGGETTGVKSEMLYRVSRGPLKVTLTENGSLMARNSEAINSKSRRGGKITFLIEEGKTVEEGEELCTLDATELEKQLQQLELDLVKTEADLDTARTELEIQATENVASIEKAGIALTKAEKGLERYRDGDAPKDRRNLEVAIKEAENNYTKAKKKYEDSEMLLEKEYINRSQVDEDKIAYERATIQLESAQRDLEIFDTYTRPMTMTEKDAAVADSRREVENAEKRAKSRLRQREVAVESQETRLTQLSKQKEEIQEEIINFTIVAPSPGIVIYGDPNQPWYRENIKLGNQIWGGMTLFTIPDLRVMQVQVQVHEADINKVKVEQVATVTMDTYPGLVLRGAVAKIAALASDTGRFGGGDEVKKFTVDIVLDDTGGETLKPGISAKAEIFIDERADVVAVPIQCVFLEEGEHFCYVHDESTGEPRRVGVKPAISNDNMIEIEEGLSVGDRVLLYNPTIRRDRGADADGRTRDASGEADEGSAADDTGDDAGEGSGDETSTETGDTADAPTPGAAS